MILSARKVSQPEAKRPGSEGFAYPVHPTGGRGNAGSRPRKRQRSRTACSSRGAFEGRLETLTSLDRRRSVELAVVGCLFLSGISLAHDPSEPAGLECARETIAAGNRTLPGASPDGCNRHEGEQSVDPPVTTAPPTAARGGLKPPSFFLLLKRNVPRVLGAPLHWDGRAWKRVGIGVAVLGAVMLADDRIRDEVQRHPDNAAARVAKAIEPFGAEYSFGVLAGFYGAGRLFHDPRAAAVAEDGLASSLIAAGIVTPALKVLTGRRRPSQSSSAYDFLDGGSSFPSGHTTQAFAVAAVVAEHYDSAWTDVLAYGIASLVGYSRMVNNAHFATDVIAGAVIGVAVGKAVVRINAGERKVLVAPVVTSRGVGLGVRVDLDRVFGRSRRSEGSPEILRREPRRSTPLRRGGRGFLPDTSSDARG